MEATCLGARKFPPPLVSVGFPYPAAFAGELPSGLVSDCSAACATSVHCTLFAPAFCSAAFAAISERSASSIAFLGCAWSAARDFARSSRWRSISCCRASRAARKRSSSASFSPCLRSCLILCRDLGVASWCWASVACVAGLATLGAGSCPASLGCPVLGAASIVASVSRSFACVCAAVILSVSLRRFCCQNLRRLLYALLLAPRCSFPPGARSSVAGVSLSQCMHQAPTSSQSISRADALQAMPSVRLVRYR